mmetsp:Transcript_36658/g.70658  ORF Transcript_36658/g.70658 Transcript_36658/m.70658 type:complete len:83 (-) Transcript_36658:232-480(-)
MEHSQWHSTGSHHAKKSTKKQCWTFPLYILSAAQTPTGRKAPCMRTDQYNEGLNTYTAKGIEGISVCPWAEAPKGLRRYTHV